MPFADFVLFRSTEADRLVVNIGGIANVTCLFRGAPTLDRVIAFDTGPGNCVSDHLMRRHDPEGPGYDFGGSRPCAADEQAGVRRIPRTTLILCQAALRNRRTGRK